MVLFWIIQTIFPPVAQSLGLFWAIQTIFSPVAQFLELFWATQIFFLSVTQFLGLFWATQIFFSSVVQPLELFWATQIFFSSVAQPPSISLFYQPVRKKSSALITLPSRNRLKNGQYNPLNNLIFKYFHREKTVKKT